MSIFLLGFLEWIYGWVKFIRMHELSFTTQGFLWASKTWNINFCEHQPWTQSEKLSKYVKLRLSPFVKVSDLLLKYSKFYPRKTLFLTSRWDLTFSLVLTMSTGFLSDNKHQNFNLKFMFNLNMWRIPWYHWKVVFHLRFCSTHRYSPEKAENHDLSYYCNAN